MVLVGFQDGIAAADSLLLGGDPDAQAKCKMLKMYIKIGEIKILHWRMRAVTRGREEGLLAKGTVHNGLN